MGYTYEFEVRQKLFIDSDVVNVNTKEEAQKLVEQGWGVSMGHEPELILVQVSGGLTEEQHLEKYGWL